MLSERESISSFYSRGSDAYQRELPFFNHCGRVLSGWQACFDIRILRSVYARMLTTLYPRKHRLRLIRHAAFGEDSFRFATMLGASSVVPHNLPPRPNPNLIFLDSPDLQHDQALSLRSTNSS